MGKLILNGIEYAGGPSIDDINSSATKVYSSQKTQNLVSGTLGADVYDATHTYATNDMCIYNNTLYKAKSSTTGNLPTDTTYWTSTTIKSEINELNLGLSDTNSKIDFLRSKCYLGNYSSFTITMPDIRQGGNNFNHKTMVIGYNAFAILNCAYSDSIVTIVSLGSNTITATKSANSFNITVNLNDTSWGGIRVITLD